MTIKELEEYFIHELSLLYDAQEAGQLFYLSAAHVSGWSRSQLLMNRSGVCENEQLEQYNNVLSELKKGRPLQHIFSETWFYGLKFRVSGAVLIPRPETEELVEWILETAALSSLQVEGILDIGTGSGCIAITLKKHLQDAAVSALDISSDALEVAKENAVLNSTEVNFIQSDVLNYSSPVKYDIIVSNPPYITEDERADMHQNVLLYEPHLALFVSNENPLIFYKSIADLAICQLRPSGKLFFEINEYLGKEMIDMLTDKGFTDIELKKDMQGKDRMICCSL